MSSLTTAPLAGAVRARVIARANVNAPGSKRAATVRPAASGRHDEAPVASPVAKFAMATAVSLLVTLPASAVAPMAQVSLTVDEQIAKEVAMYDGMKASCKNESCRITTQSWEDAAVKKIKKKNGIVTEKVKTQYPAAPKVQAAPAVAVEAAIEAPAPVQAPTPKAEISPADAKAEAKARLAERQATSAAAAEQAASEKAAKVAAAKATSEQAAAEKAAAIKAKAAEAEAAKAAKADAKSAPATPKPAPAPAAKKAAPAPAKKAEPKKTTAPKKQAKKGPTAFDAVVGDATVLALATAVGIGLVKPSVKDKALGGDVAAAYEEGKAFVTGTEGVIGKAAAAGAVVAVDAVAHLPVLGFLLPGPLEYVGACAATLLAARYVVTKDATVEEDFSNFGKSLPSELPQPDDVVTPVTAIASKLSTFASDFDIEKTKGDVIAWFNGLEEPVETIAPPAAALFVANLIVYAVHFPVINVAAPRALELAGVVVAIAAVEKYGNTSAKFKEDLGRYAVRGGDAIKSLIEK